jgi:iron complex outermembrane recepter protein
MASFKGLAHGCETYSKLCFTGCLFAFSVDAVAQSSAESGDVVSVNITAPRDYVPDTGIATKSDTAASQAPFATSTIGRMLLQDRGLTSMQEALRTAPGVAPIIGIGGFNARYRYRGFLASSQLKDGFRSQSNFQVTEFQNVETLEVLRGPASSLYGRFEPGGVLNVVTKRPGVTVGAASATLDSFGQKRITGDVGGQWGESVGFRLNGAFENSDTYRDYAKNESNFISPAFQWKIGSKTTLNLNAEYLDRKGVFDRGFPLSLAFPVQSLSSKRFLGDPSDTFSNKTQSANALLTHKFETGPTMRVGFATSSAKSSGDYFFPVGTTPLISASGILSRRNQLTEDITKDQTALIEINGVMTFGSMEHKWFAGFEKNESSEDSRINRSTQNALLNVVNPVYGSVRSPATASIVNSIGANQTTALSLQNEIALLPQLRFTIGLRTEKIDSTFEDRGTKVLRQSSASPTIWRGGLAWSANEDLLFFANYSQSFSPEVTSRALVGGADPVPSRGSQWELGVRKQFMDKRIQTSASVFDITRQNVRVAEPAPSVLDRQVGEQRSQGVELEVIGRPTKQSQILANLTYLDTEVTQDTAALLGKRFNGVPKLSSTVWGRYDVNAKFAVGGGLVYSSDRFVDPANTFKLPGYVRWDFSAYGQITKDTRWQVNLINAFNKSYFENGNTTGNFYPGLPRTLRVSLSTRFL